MSYNRVSESDIASLRGMVAPDRMFTGEQISGDYAHDELGGVERMPDVLIRVKTTEEVAAVMKYAYEHDIPVVARGSGTGLVGGAVALEGGIMIETTLMNRVIELDEDNLTLTVQPGMLLMELADYVQKQGFFYPPDPGEKSATIGGNISTNAGGMRAVKYGVTRDYVRGLTVVLPDGGILQLGGKVVKNSSGYSLKDLVIGSEGTLCIITEAILKLLPLPKYSISLLAPFRTMEEAIAVVPKIIRSPVTPTAVEYMTRDTILYAEEYLGKKFPDTKNNAYILLTFDGMSRQHVEDEYTLIAEDLLAEGALDVYLVDTDERKDSVWKARGAFLEAIKASCREMDECDVVVPRRRIDEFINFTHGIAEKYGMRIPSFGHAGDGNLHIYLCRDEDSHEEWLKKTEEIFRELYGMAKTMGGLVSGEHGIGFAKKGYLHDMYGDAEIELMQRIKKSFDPKLLLNPGKICF